jgi:hypothetical protein
MTTNMASGWDAYTNLAITAGAERCALFGLDKTKWGGSGPNGGVTVIRNFDQLIADVKAGQITAEMHFDGVKFMNTTILDARAPNQIHIGKAGDYACAVSKTTKTIIIVITKGTPQAAVLHMAPVFKAVTQAGQ